MVTLEVEIGVSIGLQEVIPTRVRMSSIYIYIYIYIYMLA
jgi:hypothetical protein